jgi:hypothetical protein
LVSRVFVAAPLVVGGMMSLFLLAVLAARPKLESAGAVAMFAALGFGYMLTFWIFFYVQVSVAHVIRARKAEALNRIEIEMAALEKNLKDLSPEGLGRLKTMVELHDAVLKGPSTTASLRGVGYFAVSLAIQTAVGVFSLLGPGGRP